MVEKDALQYIVDLSAPTIIARGGLEYTDRPLSPIPDPSPGTIHTTTLRSVVEYVNKSVDKGGAFPPENVIVHVRSPREVTVLSECQKDGARWERIVAAAVVPNIPFREFLDIERFNIMLQSMFMDSDDRAKVLAVVCNVSDGAVQDHADDGITQTVTVRAGIQRVGTEKVPNPVILAPFRTFPDIIQPISPFVLRVQSGAREGMLPTAALFEADGTAWRLTAMEAIKAYLEGEFNAEEIETGRIVVLA